MTSSVKTKKNQKVENLQKDEAVKPTGISEVDQMLHGGFPAHSTVLLAGASGTGKTIFSMQWLFAGCQQHNESGLYISFTEPVSKLASDLSTMSFFEKSYLNDKIHLADFRDIVGGIEFVDEKITMDDINKIVLAIKDIVEKTESKRIVFDSITAMAYRLKDKDLIRDFIFQLGSLLAELDANIILTSEVSGDGYSMFGVEEFISDGIIKLDHIDAIEERVRKFEIIKMRGMDFDTHSASYRISDQGFVVFPRLSRELSYEVVNERVSTGIKGLDGMTNGGYYKGSSILITGASGVGKSLISLQFIVAGLKKGEKGLYVSFEESRDQLYRNASSFGWDLKKYEAEGLLKILVSYPEQLYLEEHVDSIKAQVDDFAATRVVVDSLSSLGNVFSDNLLRDFVSRLTAYLKQHKVTTLFTVATNTLMGAGTITDSSLSTLTDHIIMLRYVEIESELRHALLILKMRGSAHDKRLREIAFGKEGVHLTSGFEGFEGVLLGSTRKVSGTIEEQLHALFLEILGPMGERVFEEQKSKGLTMNNIESLLDELGDQGILSERRKSDFIVKSEKILTVREKFDDSNDDSAQEPMGIEDFLNAN